ncbi:MAG: sulfite exporter TauE/SafE family protein [Mucispirillum sp.]|uniref:Sulfite exporter TauE/SafE family protein n=1 Tax=Candidatus Mucispirillum faecigallinarum TaxID=2838699 RepID=A0A9D2KAF8_9BACT|nr:sulfite exporter TauE/SafE family protein [Mucispirillum sp.]HIZ88700.1 sulfite exporter TauE/SafE family protein [Candidatus Mucispirillum faecigallinarum]
MESLGLIFSHFLVGFAGGFGHCILMCHPFVLHISSTFADSNSGYKILIPNFFYNAGRTITYAGLGAVAGGLGSIATYAGQNFLNIQKFAALVGGIILVLFAAMYFFNLSSFNFLAKLKIMNKIKKFKPNNPFFYGLLLGFLPCGLSMGAIIATVPSGSWYTGALMMAAFGVGTAVALMILAILGSYIMKYVKYFKHITAILLFIMGIYFIYQGIIFSY